MKNNKNPKKLKDSMKLVNNKIIAGIFTIAILGLIIFAGPAKAFILKLDTDKDSLTKGGEITFTATLDIEAMDEYLPVKNLILNIKGPSPLLNLKVCEFDIRGNPVSGCDGMTITPINIDLSGKHGEGYGYGYDNSYGYGYPYNFGYDYGYGYGYGAGGSKIHLVYEITLDTTNYATGNYESQLNALIRNKTFESKDKPTFTVNPSIDDSSSSKKGGSKIIESGCITEWVCSSWSACSEGLQTRNCEKEISYCYAGLKPSEVQKCIIELGSEKETEETKGLISRMTGAVIGAATSTTGMIIIIFLISLGGVFIGVRAIRKRK